MGLQADLALGGLTTLFDWGKFFAFDLPNANTQNAWRKEAVGDLQAQSGQARQDYEGLARQYQQEASNLLGKYTGDTTRQLTGQAAWYFGGQPEFASRGPNAWGPPLPGRTLGLPEAPSVQPTQTMRDYNEILARNFADTSTLEQYAAWKAQNGGFDPNAPMNWGEFQDFLRSQFGRAGPVQETGVSPSYNQFWAETKAKQDEQNQANFQTTMQAVRPGEGLLGAKAKVDAANLREGFNARLQSTWEAAKAGAADIGQRFVADAQWYLKQLAEGPKAEAQMALDALTQDPNYNPDDPLTQRRVRAVAQKYLQTAGDAVGAMGSQLVQLRSTLATQVQQHLDDLSSKLDAAWAANEQTAIGLETTGFQADLQVAQALQDTFASLRQAGYTESMGILTNSMSTLLQAVAAGVEGNVRAAEAMLGTQLSMPMTNPMAGILNVYQTSIQRALGEQSIAAQRDAANKSFGLGLAQTFMPQQRLTGSNVWSLWTPGSKP